MSTPPPAPAATPRPPSSGVAPAPAATGTPTPTPTTTAAAPDSAPRPPPTTTTTTTSTFPLPLNFSLANLTSAASGGASKTQPSPPSQTSTISPTSASLVNVDSVVSFLRDAAAGLSGSASGGAASGGTPTHFRKGPFAKGTHLRLGPHDVSGWLLRRDAKRQWFQRFIVLSVADDKRAELLEFGEDTGEAPPLERVALGRGTRVADVVDDSFRKIYLWSVLHHVPGTEPTREIMLGTVNAKDRSRWIAALNRAISDAARLPRTTDSSRPAALSTSSEAPPPSTSAPTTPTPTRSLLESGGTTGINHQVRFESPAPGGLDAGAAAAAAALDSDGEASAAVSPTVSTVSGSAVGDRAPSPAKLETTSHSDEPTSTSSSSSSSTATPPKAPNDSKVPDANTALLHREGMRLLATATSAGNVSAMWVDPDAWRETTSWNGVRVFRATRLAQPTCTAALAMALVRCSAATAARVAVSVTRQRLWDPTVDRIDVLSMSGSSVRARIVERPALARATVAMSAVGGRVFLPTVWPAPSFVVERSAWCDGSPSGNVWIVASRGNDYEAVLRFLPVTDNACVVHYLVDAGPISSAFPFPANQSRALALASLRDHVETLTLLEE